MSPSCSRTKVRALKRHSLTQTPQPLHRAVMSFNFIDLPPSGRARPQLPPTLLRLLYKKIRIIESIFFFRRGKFFCRQRERPPLFGKSNGDVNCHVFRKSSKGKASHFFRRLPLLKCVLFRNLTAALSSAFFAKIFSFFFFILCETAAFLFRRISSQRKTPVRG